MQSIAATAAESRADAIGELYAGTLSGIVLRGAFEPAQLTDAMRRIEAGDVRMPRVEVPVFKGYLLGVPLVAARSGIEAYLDAADAFRSGAAALFDGVIDLDAHLGALLGSVGGGRPVSVPMRGGRRYLAAGFRVLVDGDALPLHYENTTFENPCLAELAPLLDRATLMSFYVQVKNARDGGELRLYDVSCDGENSRLIERLGGDAAARPWFRKQQCDAPALDVGDMLVFDGGRFYHEVTPVVGGPRCTLGGFLALSADHRAVYFWS